MWVYDEKNNKWIDVRTTAEYKQRVSKLKGWWIWYLISLAITPAAVIFGGVLFGVFLTFAYLDEVPYHL